MERVPELPPRIFAAGEEPHGQRVNSYLKPGRIRSILNALDPDEAKEIKESSFGKLLATTEKPSFSGAFGQFIITRMLYVKKKHEIWFLFAGWPIRVSMREFCIVTGLPCGPYPKTNKKKKRNLVKDQKYFGELFGCLDPHTLTVDKVIKLIKRRVVRDRDRRIKYAYLALTASVLCPTSHFPKIIDDHVELIRDLDVFLAYPWGRLSFEMVVGSIKAKDELALAQRSVAVQGFFHAFQLVMVEAVPALLEVVEVGQSSSSSESDSDMEDETRNEFVDSLGEPNIQEEGQSELDRVFVNNDNSPTHKISLSPAHARDLDFKCEASVQSIIPADPLTMQLDENIFDWSDDVVDEKVDTMVKLIVEGFRFEKHLFKGGATASDLERIRKEKKGAKERKEKEKTNHPSGSGPSLNPSEVATSVDLSHLVEMVAERVKIEMSGVETRVSNCCSDIVKVGESVKAASDRFDLAVLGIKETLLEALTKLLDKPPTVPNTVSPSTQRQPNNSRNGGGCSLRRSDLRINDDVGREIQFCPITVVQNVMNDLSKSFQNDGSDGGDSEVGDNAENSHPSENNTVQQEDVNDDNIPSKVTEATDDAVASDKSQRRSKRQRTQSHALDGFECPNPMRLRNDLHPLIHVTSPDVDYKVKYTKLAKKLKSNRIVNLNNGTQVSGKDVLEIAERSKVMSPKVVDALVYFSRTIFMRAVPGRDSFKYRFLDTKLVATFMKQYPKFSKFSPKDRIRFVFHETVLESFRPFFEVSPTPERFYFPFLVDKSHWVGVCVDIIARSIQVLDCNTSLRSDSLMKRDLSPVSVMLPYLIGIVCPDPSSCAPVAYSLDRARGVPQNDLSADSAVTTMLLIGAHSIAGLEGCKCITSESLPLESKRLAVVFYEEYGGSI